MIGIVCKDTIEIVGHSLFNNFRLALANYFKESEFVDINSVSDLQQIKKLIIVDEHFSPHVNIWQSNGFVDTLNSLNIQTTIFNFEKIFNSAFPWNIQHQRTVESINKCTQIVSDITDALILGKPYINKQCLSKSTNFDINTNNNKINKILFIGQIEGSQYTRRRNIISALQQRGHNIEVINTNRQYTYHQFLSLINDYKYVLNPLGTGEFINLRFYEALYFYTIPIQEVNEKILEYNPEIIHKAITFSDDFNLIDNTSTTQPTLTLEDHFKAIKLENII